MRKLVVPTACVALAACNPGSGESAQNEQASATAEQVMAADGESPEGRYRATSEEGVVLFEDLNEDGTYVFTDEAGEVVEEGQFEQKSPESPCFTPNAEGAAQKCYIDEFGGDGVWRTIDPDTGEIWVLERIEAE